MSKAPHHSGTYYRRAKHLRAAANANPNTRCWRCGRTLPEHEPHTTGRPATWHAGHVIPGDPSSPLLPEASTCNQEAAAHNRRHRQPPTTGYTWP